MLGALGYGFAGYIWQYLFYMFLGAFVLGAFMKAPQSAFLSAVSSFVLTLISSVFAVLSIYWGIYLTNQKQISIYRSATVGLGFALGKTAVDLIYSYGYSIFAALQINQGTFRGEESLKESILNTSAGSLIAGTYKCFLMLIIVFAIALVMGKYYTSKNRAMTWISGLIMYEAVTLLNVIVRGILPGDTGNVIFMVLLTVLAAGAAGILRHWFKTGEVWINPLKVYGRK